MRLFLYLISSFLVAPFLALIVVRFLLRRRRSWRNLPLGRSIAKMMKIPPLWIQNGPWRLDLSFGSKEAGFYTRAFAARRGLYALRAPETIYFATTHDSGGRPLDGGCTYCIQGSDPDTRWWSLTVYKNDHLIANDLNRYSFTKTTVSRGPDGLWRIYLSPREQPENWLPTGEPKGLLVLIFRFYNPSKEVLAAPEKIQLPEIQLL
jgi:hypothetical protein